MLIAENLASIHHRYPDTLDGGTVPGPIDAYLDTDYVFSASDLLRPRSKG